MIHCNIVPLLNTCLGESKTIDLRLKFPLMVIIVASMIAILPSASSVAYTFEDTETNSNTNVLDVYFLDLPCDDNSTCELSRPSHLVEYFGADWCEPCESLESLLSALNFDDIALIQHHPSVLDQSFLNSSKDVFDRKYRLLFIPSLVINSHSLLTGSAQGAELNQSLMDTKSEFAGISDILIDNGILYWNTSTNSNLTIWRLEQTAHEYDNRTLPHLAVERITISNTVRQQNISHFLNNQDGRLVFMLQDDNFPKSLQSISTGPTGDKTMSELGGQDGLFFAHDGGYDLAIGVFVILFLTLLPALVWFRNLQKQDFEEAE